MNSALDCLLQALENPLKYTNIIFDSVIHTPYHAAIFMPTKAPQPEPSRVTKTSVWHTYCTFDLYENEEGENKNAQYLFQPLANRAQQSCKNNGRQPHNDTTLDGRGIDTLFSHAGRSAPRRI